MNTKIRFILALAVTALGSGCSHVQPWQRGTLADISMRAERNSAHNSLNEHVWFSREAATGGRGLSAGGCGCN